jgi:RNA polymerase sigma-70 factor (ECF subfamily)
MHPTPATPASLLNRLRVSGEEAAWSRFVKLYTPLLFFWARRLGLQEHDASDLVQDVFTILVQKLPEFHYEQRKGFRNWLRTVLLNRWRDQGRRPTLVAVEGNAESLTTLPSPEDDAFGEEEYRKHLVKRALEIMRTEFSPNIWQACWEHVVKGRCAAEVAAELDIAVGTVYVAKSRVLRRLRQELEGLLD